MSSESLTLEGAAPLDLGLDLDVPAPLREGVRQFAPMLYKELRRLAHRERVRLHASNTLTTTALVHESFLRLYDKQGFASELHFLRVAAAAMRYVLIDRVRAQLAAKRGGGLKRVPIEEAEDVQIEDDETVFAVHEALKRLAQFAPRQAEVVECRYFAGYGDAEIAEALGITERTVRRDWVAARAWLAKELGAGTATAAMGEAVANE